MMTNLDNYNLASTNMDFYCSSDGMEPDYADPGTLILSQMQQQCPYCGNWSDDPRARVHNREPSPYNCWSCGGPYE